MASPKPVVLTQADTWSGNYDPEPLVVIGNLPHNAQNAIADISTTNASDLDTAIALANATKTKVNAILAALRSSGLIAT